MLRRLVVAMTTGGMLTASALGLADAGSPFPKDNSTDRAVDAPVHVVMHDALDPFPKDNSRDRSVDGPVQIASGGADSAFPSDHSRGRSDRSLEGPVQIARGSIDSPFPRDNSRDRSVDTAPIVALPETRSPFPSEAHDGSIHRLA